MGGWTWDDWDVYVMQANGSDVRRVTVQKSRTINGARFVNHGRAVLFSGGGRNDRFVPELYHLPLDGRAQAVAQPLE
jgi:hypothetical protein